MANTIHLQGIGSVPAKPASEFSAGDKIMYNYGIVGEVVKVEVKGKSLYFTTLENGKTFTTRRNSKTLLAVGK